MKWIALLLCLTIFSCESLRTRSQVGKSAAGKGDSKVGRDSQRDQGSGKGAEATTSPQPTPPPQPPEATAPSGEPLPEVPIARQIEIPKIGLIVSGGGAKALASIGVLKELYRTKIPIHSIAGMEMGAFIASVYAKNRLPNEVEWQISKMDPRDFSETQSAEKLSKFLSHTWNQEPVEALKIPFACSSIHLGRQQSYVLAKGQVKQMLSYCMPYPPLFAPFDQSISGVSEVKSLSDYLRSRGANYVILVNSLGSSSRTPRSYLKNFESAENISWIEASMAYRNPIGVDYTLSLDTENYGIMNFDKRRELMSAGQEQAAKLLEHLKQKFGL